MKASSLSFAVGMGIACAAASAPAVSATYYCDNDRSSSQYPHCDNGVGYDPTTHYIPWTYRKPGGNDWNGDDRVNTHVSQYYEWFFDTQAAYRYSAWLSNSNFTDPRARYTAASYSSASGWHNTILGTINQNTAPSGWNVLGSRAVTSREIDVRASGSGQAGADIMRAVSGSSAANAEGSGRLQSDAPGAPAQVTAGGPATSRPMDPQVAAIQAKMLGAASHYRDAQGSFDAAFGNSGQDESVDFESSPQRMASVVNVTDHAAERAMRYVSDGTLAKTVDANARTVTIEDRAIDDGITASTPATSRAYIDANGTPVFVHHADPAGATAAGDVLNPENYAFWLTDSDARVTDHQVLLGRKVSVISGTHDAYLAKKLGATRFTMWVDDATGVLLKLVGQDSAGDTAYFIKVNTIRFDTGVSDIASKMTIPANYTAVRPQTVTASAPLSTL